MAQFMRTVLLLYGIFVLSLIVACMKSVCVPATVHLNPKKYEISRIDTIKDYATACTVTVVKIYYREK